MGHFLIVTGIISFIVVTALAERLRQVEDARNQRLISQAV